MKGSVKSWILERGVLYALTQLPLAAIIFGFFIKVLPYPVTILGILVGFVLLPIWVLHRKTNSTNPNEPVHHFTKFALWSIVPFPIFSLLRIPTHFIYNMSYWHPWYDFGNSLTGYPVNHVQSLAAGALLYSLQGFSLTMGYYVFFERRSLLNAILYICVFDSALYSFVFPTFGRIGMPSPLRWHLVAWLAHLGMAVIAWAIPKFWSEKFPRMKLKAKVASLAVLSLIVLTPYAFPFMRALTWQFPTQEAQDLDVFSKQNLRLVGHPKLATNPSQNLQESVFTLEFEVGPRTYKNYVNRLRTVDYKDFQLTAKIYSIGKSKGIKILAWCQQQFNELESPNLYIDHEKQFFQKINELNFTRISITCFGPRLPGSFENLEVTWDAKVNLVGERLTRMKQMNSDWTRKIGIMKKSSEKLQYPN